MQTNYRVLVARIALPLVTVWFALLPARSYAWSVADTMSVVAVYGTTATLGVQMGLPAGVVGGLSLAAGMQLGYIGFCPAYSLLTGDDPCVKVPTGTGAAATVPLPTGLPATVPVIPSSWQWAGGAGCVSGITHTGFSSHVDAFADYVSTINGRPTCTGGGTYTYSVCPSDPLQVTYGSGCYSPMGVTFSQPAATCPVGYTLSSGVCNLTDPVAASNVKERPYKRNGTALSVTLSPSNHAQPFKDKVMTVINSNDTVRVTGLSMTGNLMVGEVTALPTGGAKTRVQQNTGTRTITETVFYTDPDGKVISTPAPPTTSTCVGQVYYDANGDAVPVENCSTNNINNPSSSVPATDVIGDIPSLTAASGVPDLTSSFNQLIGAASAVQAAEGSDEAAFTKAYSWWMPPAPSSCSSSFYGASGAPPSVQMPITGVSYALFDICSSPFIQRIPEGLDWAMATYTAWSIFTSFYRRPD